MRPCRRSTRRRRGSSSELGAASVASSARLASSATTAWRRWTRFGSCGTRCKRRSTADSRNWLPTLPPTVTPECLVDTRLPQVSSSERGALAGVRTIRPANCPQSGSRRWTRSGSCGTHCRKPSTVGSPSSPPTWTPTGTRACPMVIGRRQVSTSEVGAIAAGTTVGWAASARSASTGSKRFQAGRGVSKTTLGLTVTSICDGSSLSTDTPTCRRTIATRTAPDSEAGCPTNGPATSATARRGPCQPTPADRWLDMGGSSAERRSGCSLRGIRGLIVPGVSTTAKPEQCAPEQHVFDSHSPPLPQRMNDPHAIDDEDAPRLRILGRPFTADDEPDRGVRIDVVGTAVRVRHPLQRPMRREGTSLMNARDIDRLTAATADVDSEDRLKRLPRRRELITPFVERGPVKPPVPASRGVYPFDVALPREVDAIPAPRSGRSSPSGLSASGRRGGFDPQVATIIRCSARCLEHASNATSPGRVCGSSCCSSRPFELQTSTALPCSRTIVRSCRPRSASTRV